MILSLPNLKEVMRIEDCETIPKGPLPIYFVTPQRRLLDSLKLYRGHAHRIGDALAESRLTSRHLSLGGFFRFLWRR